MTDKQNAINFAAVERLKQKAEQQAINDFEQAMSTLEQAAEIALGLDDPMATALVWRGRATIYQQHGMLDRCLHSIQSAVDIYERHGTPFDIAKARTVEVAVHSDMGNFEQAIELGAWIRREFEHQDFTFGLARLAAALGYTYNAAWRLEESFQEHQTAYHLYQQLALKLDAAWVLHNMGVLANQMDRLDLACEHYTAAYSIFVDHGDRVMMVKAQFNLAQNAVRRARFNAALEHLTIARRHLETQQGSVDHGYVELHEAQVRQRLNQPRQAEQLLRRAVERFEAQGARLESAEALLSLSHLLVTINRADVQSTKVEEGIACIDQAIAHLNAVDAPLFQAWAELERAELFLSLQRWPEAVRQATELVPRFTDADQTLRKVQAHLILAEAEEALHKSEAEQRFQYALNALGDNVLPLTIRSWHGLGRLALKRRAWSDAEHAFTQALGIFQLLRRTLQAHWQQAGLLEDGQTLVDGLLSALHAQPDRASDVLPVLEQNKASVLAEMLAGQPVDNSADPKLRRLLAKREALTEQLDHGVSALKRDLFLVAGDDPMPARTVRSYNHHHTEHTAALRLQLQECDEAIARHNSPAQQWREGSEFDSSMVAQLLDDETLLVSYYTVRDQLFALTATRSTDSHRSIRLPTTLSDVRRKWRHTERLLMRGDAVNARLQQQLGSLYNLLIAPLGLDTQSWRRLLLIPHRELSQIPFAALFDQMQGCYLVENYVLQMAPSITVLKFCRDHVLDKSVQKSTSCSRSAVLLVGYPGEANDPDYLPSVWTEVEDLRTRFSDAEVLFGEEVTRERLLHALTDRSLIHVAGHAVFDSIDPLASGLPLAAGRWLRAGDLYLRYGELEGALVVLSGCSTARGKISGAELLGLPSAFLYAGAGAVLSGLWKIDDAATAQLMGRFYHALASDALDSAAALRQAQLKMLADTDFSAPYYWAPFVLSGADLMDYAAAATGSGA